MNAFKICLLNDGCALTFVHHLIKRNTTIFNGVGIVHLPHAMSFIEIKKDAGACRDRMITETSKSLWCNLK